MKSTMENWLNENLVWDDIRDALQSSNHHVVENIFKEDIAEKIYGCLDSEVPWHVAFRQNGQDVIVTQQEMKKWTAEDQQNFHANLMHEAINGYQFYYNRYAMIASYMQGKDPGLFLHTITDFLNSEPFLEFSHHITGDMEIRKAEPHASCYIAGNFLRLHDDYATKEMDRRYALVFNMSKDWPSDWGGLLQLVDDNHVKETITPKFNSVSILRLPQKHQVSYVAPYATGKRMAITTWLRAD